MASLKVKLLVPTRQVSELEAEYVEIPSAQGMMGVLADHAPLRCALEPGVVSCRVSAKETRTFSVAGGLAMIRDNEIVLLADTAEDASDIDVERAKAARERALERVRALDAKVDTARAEVALKRSIARINASDRRGL